MKATLLIITLVLATTAVVHAKLPVMFRVEKQALSTPMTEIDEVFFNNYFIAKPVNVKFDGNVLNLFFDNGTSFLKKELEEVKVEKSLEGEELTQEIYYYSDKTNPSDSYSLVIDYMVGYVQLVVPTKNSKGEAIGYTSYKKFNKENELASN